MNIRTLREVLEINHSPELEPKSSVNFRGGGEKIVIPFNPKYVKVKGKLDLQQDGRMILELDGKELCSVRGRKGDRVSVASPQIKEEDAGRVEIVFKAFDE